MSRCGKGFKATSLDGSGRPHRFIHRNRADETAVTIVAQQHKSLQSLPYPADVTQIVEQGAQLPSIEIPSARRLQQILPKIGIKRLDSLIHLARQPIPFRVSRAGNRPDILTHVDELSSQVDIGPSRGRIRMTQVITEVFCRCFASLMCRW